MMSKQDDSEPTAEYGGKRSNKWLTAVWGVVLVVVVAACFYTWPLQENSRLLRKGGFAMYHIANHIAWANTTQKALNIHESLGNVRMPAVQSDVTKTNNCAPDQGSFIRQSLLRTNAISSSERSLPALSCNPLPMIHSVLALAPNKPKAIRLTSAASSVPGTTAKTTDVKKETTTIARSRGPIELTSLRDRATCNQGVVLNVVAHEDDDILFMNPDIQTDIVAGRCMRTVYLTAGDAGQSEDYWLAREQGAKSAYAAMYRVNDNWRDGQQLVAGRRVTVSYLQDVPQISLVFMRLPDGNLTGEGFSTTASNSLRQLLDGQIVTMKDIQGESNYSQTDIVDTLADVMQIDAPGYIRSQNPLGEAEGDHADHAAAGTITAMAHEKYKSLHTLAIYAGYPDRTLDPNITPDQFYSKQAVFLAYAVHDNAVCQTAEVCAGNATYGSYLARQYKLSEVTSGQ